MKLSDRALGISKKSSDDGRNFASRGAIASGPIAIKLWFLILGSGLLTGAGPMISRTVTHVGLISIQILLELSRLGLTTFQAFGN